jgi:YHS domain-containing protein
MKIRISSIITAATIAFTGLAAASPGHDHDHGKEEPKKEEPKKKEPKKEEPKKEDPKKEEGKVKPYKPDTCIVSDEKLGEMGKPVTFEYKGQEIKLCCKDCRKDFDKDPAKYLKKLEEKK